MAEKKPSEPIETEHSYLDVGPTGPRRWVLVIGTLLVLLAVVAAFYGLYTINQSPAPTLSPEPAALTQVALAATGAAAGAATPSRVPVLVTPSTTPTATLTVVPTAEPPTYTVQQGDSLIVIARRLNVDVNDLKALNQVSGETIFPSQVLLVPPTVTPWPETGPFPHVVRSGETLSSIATLYRVNVEEIKSLNGLTSDAIFSGQQILIPAGGVRPSTPTPTPEPWVAAVITGELDSVYSLTAIKGHSTLHIAPDTRAATASETSKIGQMVETALDHVQTVLGRRFMGRFEVYVSGTLFDTPRTAQRSFSQPDQEHLFLLYDGSGTPAERLYFTAYALTQLVAAQAWGEAVSPLLWEGLAVYVAGQALASEMTQERSYLLPTQFCAAYYQTGKLPRVSRELTFKGQLGHLDQYLAAGCFVGHLIETEGSAAFSEVYLTGDYRSVYGRTLNQLESDWLATLSEPAGDLPFDGTELTQVATQVDDAYRRLWSDFEGTPTQFLAYARLDRARLSLWQGRLTTAQEHLDVLESLLGEP
jgi:LysM repeat protein